MAKSKKSEIINRFRYTASPKADHTGGELAFELVNSGIASGGCFATRTIFTNFRNSRGEWVFVIDSRREMASPPRSKEDPQLADMIAEAIAHRKPQPAYELVASDELSDFYRVRSIVRLKEQDREFYAPVFVFVDEKLLTQQPEARVQVQAGWECSNRG